MDVPKLVFQLFDENNEIELVQPDIDHVHSGDFDDYDGDDKSKLANITDINNEIERNICSISDIYDPNEEDLPVPSHVGRLPDYEVENDHYSNICSISSLQDCSNTYQDNSEDNVFSSEPSTGFNPRNIVPEIDSKDILPSITDLQGLEYEVNKDIAKSGELQRQSTIDSDFRPQLDSAISLNDPFILQSPEEDPDEGIWFKGQMSIDESTQGEELTKQCDKILTFDSQFALPIVCQPFIEKERLKRSFGERDFQRHRKDQGSTIFSGKKHHKSYKHKHPSRKDKTEGKDENKLPTEDKTEKMQLPRRPRSATFNATQVLALMPLQDISEHNVDTDFVDCEANKMKRSRSLSLHDTSLVSDDKLTFNDKPKEDESKSKHKRHHHHHKKHHHARHLKNKGLNAQDSLESRIRSGMHALEEERKALREITDEIENFGEKDRDDINTHRYGNFGNHGGCESSLLRPRRHQSGMLTAISDIDTVSVCSFRPQKPHMQIAMEEDKVAPISQLKSASSNNKESGFVELEELTTTDNNALQWKERARWIKFEEDVEKNERWGKPHVASLSFQSLLELRKGLETGTVLLNLDNYDLPTIFESIVENLIITDQIHSSMREKVIEILLSKHCHHHQNRGSSIRRRKPSTTSLASVNTKDSGFLDEVGEEIKLQEIAPTVSDPLMSECNGFHTKVDITEDPLSDNDDEDYLKRKGTVKFAPVTEEPYGPVDPKSVSDVKERIPEGAEATSVLVATIEDLERTAVAFVRLTKGCFLGNLTEVKLPVRFIFLVMGPPSNHDYFEIGRSIATLMSDKIFHDLAYSAKSRDDILAAINSFLDDSIVLAPGDWDRHLLLPLLQAEISEKRRERIKLLKEQSQWEDPDEENPLERTGKLFGGLRREVVKKAKFFKSDILDGFNLRCLVSIIFVFFATFAPTVTFGALLEKKTKGNLGVMETLIATSVSGVLFGFTSGQPLMILGTTGPILVFEEATYNLSVLFGLDFLRWRVWIGLWVMLICWVVVAFEGCFLVESFTRFTEEVFSVLISLLFVYEAISFLIKTFKAHPLLDYETLRRESNSTGNMSSLNGQTYPMYKPDGNLLCSYYDPNVALISTLLLLGTFYIAYYLRKLRVSHFLSSKARRVLSDFGVPFAMVSMVAINIIAHDVSHVPKLKFKGGIEPTLDARSSFIISPLGMPGYWIVVAFFPALCVSILLFMETELTGVLLNKRKNKLKKGGGYNLDLMVMGLICGLCSVFGLPWMCAATVRSVQHQNALAIMSRSHAPGERPYLLRIIEQRLTNILIHVLIGFTVLAYNYMEEIPLAVCYGVFLYLGFSSLSGIQFIEQLKLIFVPSKYHPNRKYIRNVTFRSLVWYTMIQVVCLLLLIICKLSPAAPAFPFIIIGMVFLRRFIERYFTEDELEDLDNEDDGDFDDFDEYGVSLPC